MNVYRGYDQEELNRQYNQSSLVPDLARYSKRCTEESARVRERLCARLDVPYGPSPDETLDIFPAGAGAPVMTYFHGGAWTRRSKNDVSYVAPAFVDAGIAFVAVDFTLAPKASLDEMVRQCRAAVDWTYRNAAGFGADPDRLFVAGHSSGGHLAGMVIATDWAQDHGLPRDAIKGATVLSGIYDLEPVRLSHRNDYLSLDEGAVDRNSPIRHISAHGPPLIVGYGDGELDEFQRQSRAFAAAWRSGGLACREIALRGRNHFDVADDIADPGSPVFRAMKEQIGARP